jgi:hypothetical protein
LSDIAFRHLVLAKRLTVAQAPDPFAPLATHPYRPTLRCPTNFLSAATCASYRAAEPTP